jgi:hypothetical protein
MFVTYVSGRSSCSCSALLMPNDAVPLRREKGQVHTAVSGLFCREHLCEHPILPVTVSWQSPHRRARAEGHLAR